jgi:hypothetical protein
MNNTMNGTVNGNLLGAQISDPSSTLVLEVTHLSVGILESIPPKLDIIVRGMVPSTGWTNPQLRMHTYVQAPPDGVYDFDFVATPPKEVASEVITPIRLRIVIFGAGINGIRVHAAHNSKVDILFPVEAADAAETAEVTKVARAVIA